MATKTQTQTQTRTATAQRSVLLIGRSQLVLDESVAGLRGLGYTAQGTNDFSNVTERFDPRTLDLVVFGGQVPPDRKAELRKEIGDINPRIIFVQGLAGIPGLIISQVQGAFSEPDPAAAPSYDAAGRAIRLTLPAPAEVTVTLWWGTSFVPPDPRSDSRQVRHGRLPSGDHLVPIPAHIPRTAAFATVRIDDALHSFSIAG
ncbi:MAG TPA: hypothetical protein VFB06_09200 [Streptosporangiaceae bacterium]|nr:hypothetical protein [Streptosporangiaceae bacterium]